MVGQVIIRLKKRGDITLWLSEDVIIQWYEKERIYDGTGTPNLYTDMATLTAHEIRQVFKLPLRQCEGFINSLFKMNYRNLKKKVSSLEKRTSEIPFFARESPYTMQFIYTEPITMVRLLIKI